MMHYLILNTENHRTLPCVMLFGGEDFYSSDVGFSCYVCFGTEFFWITWDIMAANYQMLPWRVRLTSLTTNGRIFGYVLCSSPAINYIDNISKINGHWSIRPWRWYYINLLDIGSGNGSTKPFPEPMLLCHQWGPLTFTWGQFLWNCSRHLSLKCVSK